MCSPTNRGIRNLHKLQSKTNLFVRAAFVGLKPGSSVHGIWRDFTVRVWKSRHMVDTREHQNTGPNVLFES